MAIEAPINVSPDNETVYIDKTLTDPTRPWSSTNDYTDPLLVKFTFNGDNLSWYRCEFYDNVTGEILGYSYAPRENGPWQGEYRNGDEVTIRSQVATNLYENGNDYKYRFILYQADSNNQPLCDMLCVTGRAVSGSGTSITVEKGITDIDAPYVMDNTTIGYCMLEIIGDNNGTLVRNKIKITSYNKNTGVITLDSAVTGTISEGTRYKVYRNYYKTPCYFVRCRDKATITPSISINAETGGIELSAVWQIDSEKEVSLQKYKWELTSPEYDGNEIYSYHDKSAKPDRVSDKLTLDAVFPLLASGAVSAKLTTTSQDGYVQTATANLSSYLASDDELFTAYNGTPAGSSYNVEYTSGLAMLIENNRIGIRATAGSGYRKFKVWRKKANESRYKYVCDASLSGTLITAEDISIDDHTVYQYALSAKNTDTGVIKWKSLGTITTSMQNKIVIEKLSRNVDYFGLRRYGIKDTYAFIFENGRPTISIDDGQTIIKTSSYPIIISESGRFLSGDFSAAISQIVINGYYFNISDSTQQYSKILSFLDDSEYLIKLPDRQRIIAKISNKSLRRNNNDVTILNFDFTQTEDAERVIVDGIL